MALQAFIDLPIEMIFKVDSSARLGLELAAMGAQDVGIIVGARASARIERILQSLRTAGRRVTGVLECDRLEPSQVNNAVASLRGSDAIVSVGGWLQTSLSMYVCSDLRALHVAVATPPGLSTSLSRAPVPLKGCLPPRVQFKRPSLVIFDPALILDINRGEIEAEAALLCAKGIGLVGVNYLANILARCALEELKRAVACGDTQLLCFSIVLSGLANRLLPSSATLALARALHALHGIDPFLAELALLPSWLTRTFEKFRISGGDGEASERLKRIQGLLKSLSLPTLRQLGLKPKMLDLVVEYAWTYEQHYIASDPVAFDKYALRELLGEAMRI